MEEMLIGPYIRQKRLDKGWTQEYLCDGICTAPTLSRIETNDRTPSSSVLKALLERLGLPAGQFFALLSENDIAVDRLQKKIRDDDIRLRRAAKPEQDKIREQILTDLEELEKLGGEDDRFVRQFILSTKAGIGRPEGPYSPEERLEMLLEAIRLTVPRFDLGKIASFSYTVEEIMLVNQIARVYANSGNRRKAIGISSQLLKHIEKNNASLNHYPRQFCLVASNCALDLAYEKLYKKAVKLAEKGQKVCIERGEYQFLPTFTAVLAECWYFLGDPEKSTALYHQAYVLYRSFGDSRNLAIMRQEMKERLGLEPPYKVW
mgnify:FL=1